MPPSKSHAHRLLIANFLAGAGDCLVETEGDSADICATKRCLQALASASATPELDCGESGSTLRFLAPVAAALGKTPVYVRRGRLGERPFTPYPTLEPGLHELSGDVSSQFVTGLLFALPLLDGDSCIRFTSPLQSRGYVDLTCAVLSGAGVRVVPTSSGFDVPGRQVYRPQPFQVEGDWSGAAFWLAMNALGSRIQVEGLNHESAQPDRAVASLVADLPQTVDVSQYPDIFPVLTVVAARTARETRFAGIRRLRLKECDRVAAMAETLAKLGVSVAVTEDAFVVRGTSGAFASGSYRTFGDHRIAMSVAVAATVADGCVEIDNAACVAKSYPTFFEDFSSLACI